MEQLSKIIPIFAMSLRENGDIHRGERLGFIPSVNLQNSSDKGKVESCFSCSSIYTVLPYRGLAHIYTCRCELISFLLIRVFQDFQTKDVKKTHTLCDIY